MSVTMKKLLDGYVGMSLAAVVFGLLYVAFIYYIASVSY